MSDWALRRRSGRLAFDAALILGTLAAWKALVVVAELPTLILPAPEVVWLSLWTAVWDGTLWPHLLTTLTEVAGGFALGAVVGVSLGSVVGVFPTLGRLIGPYVVASQAVPKLALAPLLAVWLGFGLTPKIVIAALISFFPLFENTVLGLRSAEPAQLELFRVLRASRWQAFTRLQLPGAIPSIATGARVALVLALVGAVVAEFVGANRGLGALLISAQGVLDTPLMFAVFVVLTVLGIALYGLAAAGERAVVRWRDGG